MRRNWITLLRGSIGILVGLAVAAGCNGGIPEQTPTPEAEMGGEFAPIVSATGVVLPQTWATLSVQAAGTIEEILASEDEVVEAGEVLVRLEGEETLQATLSAARYELVAASQALEALYEDPAVRSAAAAQAVVEAEKAVDEAQRRLNNLLSSTDQADIDQAQANVILARDKLDKAREDYEPYANKPENNLVRAALLSKMAQAKKEYDAAVRLLNNLLGDAKPLDVAKAQADLELAQANLEAARKDYEILQKGPDPDDVAAAEARLANARDQLAAAESALKDLELVAPFAGTVSEIYVRAGEGVTPGMPILLLADLSHLKVETTDLNEIDVAQVRVGDRATITFDALPDLEVHGEVVRIASKAAAGSGVNYTVAIELDEIPEELRWGMTAFVDIELGR